MNFIEKLWQDLFGTTDNPKKINLREVLIRNNYEKKIFQQWKKSKERPKILGNIAQSYFLKLKDIKTPFEIHLLNSSGAEGWALLADESLKEDTMICLIEDFKEKLLNTSHYYLENSERNWNEKDDFVEITEKYYFKPDIHAQAKEAQICNQQYGNILMEYQKIDTKPMYFKVVANFYNDSMFTKALPFRDLTDYLCRI
ncbi:MAG: hypothetical protein EAZ44_03030 [Cytophagia bacterium]|nr:MAG: hypothetical protein EAZ44_03030 [Cytophagia bacterium]